MSTVLVTGGSGFVGGHTILQLLAAGHAVRTTVRSLKREAEVRATLKAAGAEAGDRLTFAAADLGDDAGWAEAVAGCEYVLHVASPFPMTAPKSEDELVKPAVDGALRVLRAARDAGVKRVVMTSSFAAIGYGHEGRTTPYTEADWTRTNGVSAYVKSKTLAERAAWDFVAREGGSLELAVINPAAIFGPALSPDFAASFLMLKRMLDGMGGCPRLYFGVVDVRDVADLHVRAMTDPAARGERFLCLGGDFMPMVEMGRILKRRLGPAGAKAPTRELADWMVRLAGLFDPAVRQFLPELGKRKSASNEKARRLLGWAPRSNEEAIVAAAESLVRMG